MIQILKNFIKKIFLLCIIFLFTSCNEKSIVFDTSQIEDLNYNSIMYVSDIGQSDFNTFPTYVNQDSSSILYAGNIEALDNNFSPSYVIFKIDNQILDDYDFCDNYEMVQQVDEVKLRIKFSQSFYEQNVIELCEVVDNYNQTPYGANYATNESSNYQSNADNYLSNSNISCTDWEGIDDELCLDINPNANESLCENIDGCKWAVNDMCVVDLAEQEELGMIPPSFNSCSNITEESVCDNSAFCHWSSSDAIDDFYNEDVGICNIDWICNEFSVVETEFSNDTTIFETEMYGTSNIPLQTPCYIEPYFINNDDLDLEEYHASNHDQETIDEILNLIIQNDKLLVTIDNDYYYSYMDVHLPSEVKNGFGSDQCSIEEAFYILLKYTAPNSNYLDAINFYSSEREYIPINQYIINYKPELIIDYKKEIEENVSFNRISFDNIDSDYLNTDEVNPNDYSGDSETPVSSLFVNTDNSSDDFLKFVAFDGNTLDDVPLLSSTQSEDDIDKELMKISLKLDNTNIETQDLNDLQFYFSDIKFTHNYPNDVWNSEDDYDDAGLDGCFDLYETGDSLAISITNQNDCDFIWNEEQQQCFKDTNRDGNYSLCELEITKYNALGTENNGEYDGTDYNQDGIWQYGEGEEFRDLGLEYIDSDQIFAGADDDYETGCRDNTYLYGKGYIGNELETYRQLVGDDVDFYKEPFVLSSNNETIYLCGQKYWQNPLYEDDASPCAYCHIDDPNGDNKNLDPEKDNWDLDLCPECNGNGEWDFEDDNQDGVFGPLFNDNGEIIPNSKEVHEGTENNNQWDWFDLNGDGSFSYEHDLYEEFYDIGADGIPDSLEAFISNYLDDNWSEDNPNGTENNNKYELGEFFFDHGIDNIDNYLEEGFNSEGKQNDGKINSFSINNLTIKEYTDYGWDNCMNDDIECIDDPMDDLDIDPNLDNFNNDNEDWEFEDLNENGIIDLDEEYDALEGNNKWDWIDDNGNGEFDINEDRHEKFYENHILANVIGYLPDIYNINFSDNDVIQLFDKPTIVSGTEVVLWISKAEKIDDTTIDLTISTSTSVDISGFEFVLRHNEYVNTILSTVDDDISMYPYAFNDLNEDGFPQTGEVDPEEKYISDFSLYSIDYDQEIVIEEESTLFNEDGSKDFVINYGFGLEGKLYFESGFNNFIYDNDQSIFISEVDTKLTINFDIESEYHKINDSNLKLSIHGFISEDIPSEFLLNINIDEDTQQITIPIGSFINTLLEQSTKSTYDTPYLRLSITDYYDNFSSLVIDNAVDYRPYINILYAE